MEQYTHENFYNEFGEEMRIRFQEAVIRGYNLEAALEEGLESGEACLDDYPNLDELYTGIGGREEFKKRLRIKMIIPSNDEESWFYD